MLFFNRTMEYLQEIYGKVVDYVYGEGSYNNTPRKIVAFGNVLLDHTAQLPKSETELLKQFQIPAESKGELDADTLAKLAAEAAERVQFEVNPGGSALNTVRILKQLGTDALFFGAVGEDKAAEKLKEILQEREIEARLATVTDVPTGQCVCIINKDTKTKALYANIGASAKLSVDHLRKAEHDETQAFLRPIERKQILYIEGFFVPQRQDVCDFIVRSYIRERRRLAINLNAEYIIRENFRQLRELARAAFFIFGNRKEHLTFAEKLGYETIDDAAKYLLEQSSTPKVIVVTNGRECVQLITNYEDEYAAPGAITFQSFHVPRVNEVVDSTGAGDAFVAAFLHAWLEKRPLSECVRMASDVAAKVVTVVGCNLP
ncbi:adenosine kinase [Bactrocera dorsalis]|uniref:Adenosine kinase n=1 Tax=Bactrocera dorsalis TaxID=27457 RepID=A0A034VN80_BACDO|nr:adenosine kinase [Bactrocera dorsalis]